MTASHASFVDKPIPECIAAAQWRKKYPRWQRGQVNWLMSINVLNEKQIVLLHICVYYNIVVTLVTFVDKNSKKTLSIANHVAMNEPRLTQKSLSNQSAFYRSTQWIESVMKSVWNSWIDVTMFSTSKIHRITVNVTRALKSHVVSKMLTSDSNVSYKTCYFM